MRFRSPLLVELAEPALCLSAPGSSVFPTVAPASEAAREVCADPAAESAEISAAVATCLTRAFILVSVARHQGFIFSSIRAQFLGRTASMHSARWPGWLRASRSRARPRRRTHRATTVRVRIVRQTLQAAQPQPDNRGLPTTCRRESHNSRCCHARRAMCAAVAATTVCQVWAAGPKWIGGAP
jgi:hypothetical protein